MKKQKNFSRERMRYAVPGVCNRFLGVHASIIALCAVLSVFVITVTLAAVVIFGVQELEPKQSLVFFCEVDNIEQVRENSAKHGNTFDIYFANYGDVGYPDDESAQLVASGAVAALYSIAGTRKDAYLYTSLNIEAGKPLDWATIEYVISLARKEL